MVFVFQVQRYVTAPGPDKAHNDEVALLIGKLEDPNHQVRIETAVLLGGRKVKEAVPGLIAIISGESERRRGNYGREERELKIAAAAALGKIGDPQAILSLEDEVHNSHSKDDPVTQAELGALKELGAVSRYIEALKDSDANVRYRAVEMLGKLKDTSALPALREALNDEGKYDGIFSVRDRAAGVLGELDDKESVPMLIKLLRDGRVQGDAIWALGKLGDKSAVPVLIDILSTEDPHKALEAEDPAKRDFALATTNISMRDGAVMALGELGDTRAVPVLIQVLGDQRGYSGYTRRFAAQTLGQLGDKSAVPVLVQNLVDPDANVRWMAEWALKQLDAWKKVVPSK